MSAELKEENQTEPEISSYRTLIETCIFVPNPRYDLDYEYYQKILQARERAEIHDIGWLESLKTQSETKMSASLNLGVLYLELAMHYSGHFHKLKIDRVKSGQLLIMCIQLGKTGKASAMFNLTVTLQATQLWDLTDQIRLYNVHFLLESAQLGFAPAVCELAKCFWYRSATYGDTWKTKRFSHHKWSPYSEFRLKFLRESYFESTDDKFFDEEDLHEAIAMGLNEKNKAIWEVQKAEDRAIWDLLQSNLPNLISNELRKFPSFAGRVVKIEENSENVELEDKNNDVQQEAETYFMAMALDNFFKAAALGYPAAKEFLIELLTFTKLDDGRESYLPDWVRTMVVDRLIRGERLEAELATIRAVKSFQLSSVVSEYLIK